MELSALEVESNGTSWGNSFLVVVVSGETSGDSTFTHPPESGASSCERLGAFLLFMEGEVDLEIL
jgi:hypothetical protein